MISLLLCRNTIIRFLVVLLLITSLIAPPCSYAQDAEDSQIFIAGFNAYQQKDYAGTIEKMNEVLLKYPDSPLRDMVLFWLSRAYYKSGNQQEAAKNLSLFSKEYPDNPLKSTVEDELIQLTERYDKGEKLSVGTPPVAKPRPASAVQQQKADQARKAAEKAAAEKAEAERQAKFKAEAEKQAAAKLAAEKAAAEKAEAERLMVAKAETERLAAAKLAAEKEAAEKTAALELKRQATLKAEEDRKSAEKAEADRLVAIKAEEERLTAERIASEKLAADQAAAKIAAEKAAVEKAEQERLAVAKSEAEKQAVLKAETERLAAAKAELERVATARAEEERQAAIKAEAARLAAAQAAAEKSATEKITAEQAELVRQAQVKAEQAKIAAEREIAARAEAEKLAAIKAEEERLAVAKAEAERLATEKATAEKLAAEQAAAKIAAAEKAAAEKAEQARSAAAKVEAEKQAALNAEQERLAAAKAEAERQAAVKAEEERLAAEKAEQAELARLAAIRAADEHQAAEKTAAEKYAAEQAVAKQAAEKLAAEKAEAARQAAVTAETERLAAEKAQAEADRLAVIKAEEQQLAARKAEEDRRTQEQQAVVAAKKKALREKAIAEFKSVIDRYPGSKSATAAAAKLKELGVAVAMPVTAAAEEEQLPENTQVLRFEVAQFAGFEFNLLVEPQAYNVAQLIAVPFEVINRGNGSDSFTLESGFPAEFKAWFSAAAAPDKTINQTPLLAAGEVFKGNINLMIPAASIDGLRFTHPVKATSLFMREATQSREIKLTAAAPLLRAMIKTAKTSPLPGEKVSYKVVILNVGSVAATDVTFRLDYPPQLEALDSVATGFKQEGKGVMMLSGLTINSGESKEFTLDFVLKNDSLAGQELLTRGEVRNNRLETTAAFVSNAAIVQAQRGVQVRSAANRLTIIPGQTVTVPFVVTNSGNIREKFVMTSAVTGAREAVVFNDLNRDGIRQASEPVITEVGPLAPKEEASIVIEIKTPRSAVDGSEGNARITFSSEGEPTRSFIGETRLVYSRPVLKMAMLGKGGQLKPGDVAAFDLTLTNSGSNLARVVELTSYWPEQLELVAADPGTSSVKDGTILWKFKEVGAGEKRTIRVSFRVKPGIGVGTAIQVKNSLKYEDQLGNRY